MTSILHEDVLTGAPELSRPSDLALLDVALVFPSLPPSLDGIGDHTAQFAAALARSARVRILTAEKEPDAIPSVGIRQAFGRTRSGIWRLVDAVAEDPPDWLVLQFDQFSYGRWGLNPFLPLAIRSIKRSCPQTRIAWIAHEDFVPVTSWKFAIMTSWQRAQFVSLGHLADLIFFSIEPWVERYSTWFPGKTVRHLPCGSNIPRSGVARAEARQRLGIEESTFIAGVFGTINASRMVPSIVRAAAALHQASSDFRLLYVGPHGAALEAALGDVPLLDAGRLPADEVSVYLAAMDLHLVPFIDGVSTRRSSFMAGLQHAVPSLGTAGVLTDAALHRADGEAFLLTPVDRPEAFEREALRLLRDPRLRTRIGAGGRRLYDASFSFESVADRFIAAVEEVS